MKTFEGRGRVDTTLEEDNRAVIFLMYLIRALSATLMISLLLYILAAGVLFIFYPVPTFPEFVLGNILAAAGMVALIFIFQVLFYFYRLRRGRLPRRSFRDIFLGYLIPILGIIATLYTAYAMGVM
ncbi:MAG: hypothetical protein Sv326_0027 [Candidatus Fermentimicrarchaeum limneticum]|uniref:Uncharacterized protein n=1 Tax=Fermentimicrarchaeum limneticum TaxID=2795018 RepID=A0A7D6BMW3_FERL1|nr:MAG: hypothetical protein Sv326_0027 [Candidatus Fermentimicrarchaeum limneticum]